MSLNREDRKRRDRPGGCPQAAGRERDSNAASGAGDTAGRPAIPGERPGLCLRWVDLLQTDSEPRLTRSSGSVPSRAAREKDVAWRVSVRDPSGGCQGKVPRAGAGAAGGDVRTLGAGPGESRGWPDFRGSPGSARRAVWAGTGVSGNTTQRSLTLTGNVANKNTPTVNSSLL